MHCTLKAVDRFFCPCPHHLLNQWNQQNCTITASHRLSSEGQRENHALTLITVPDGVEVHIVLVVREEEEAEPRVEGVDGNNEEDPHDMALLPWRAVET